MNTIVIAYDQRDVRGPIRTRLKALWLFVVGMVHGRADPAAAGARPRGAGRPAARRLAGRRPRCWSTPSTGRWCSIGLLLALTSFYHVVLPHRLPWRRHLPGHGPRARRSSWWPRCVLRAYVSRHPDHGAALRRAGRPDRRPAVLLLLRHGRAAGRRAQRDHPGPLAGAAAAARPPTRDAARPSSSRGPPARPVTCGPPDRTAPGPSPVPSRRRPCADPPGPLGTTASLALLELLVDLLARRAHRAAGLRGSWSPGRPRRTAPRPCVPMTALSAILFF